MGIVHIQRIIPPIAGRVIVLIDIAEFRIGPEQLALLNRGLSRPQPLEVIGSEERVGNLVEQAAPHGEILRVQLIEIQATRQ